jgi:HEAT repeat protein/beta-lactamase regulating signal transducer with metallopeptidase domain
MAGLTSIDTTYLATVLANVSVKVTIILTAVWLATRLLRRGSAAVRHLVWVTGVAGILILPLAWLILPAWYVPLLARSGVLPAAEFTVPSGAARSVVETAEAPADAPPSHALRIEPALPEAPAFITPRAGGSAGTRWPDMPDWPLAALVVWAAGAALLFGRLAMGLAGVSHRSRTTRAVSDPAWLALLDHSTRLLGLVQSVRLLQDSRATMPLVWGVRRAVLLLPDDANTWSRERRQVVLLHELAHVKRRDCLTQLLAQVACAVYWFNPLVWVASRRLRAERERACDDLVLAAGTSAPDYADHLLEIASRCRHTHAASWAALAMARPSQLEGRLLAILDRTRSRRAPRRSSRLVLAACVTTLVIPLAAIEPWHDDSLPEVERTVRSWSLRQAAPTPPEISSPPVPPVAPMTSVRRTSIPQPPPVPTPAPVPEPAPLAGQVLHLDGPPVPRPIPAPAPIAAPVAAERPAPQAATSATPGAAADPIGRDAVLVNALMGALEDADAEVRRQAVETLVRLRDVRAIDGLTAALADQDDEVREHAAAGLARFRSEAASGGLLLALQDQHADVRRQAAAGLGGLRDARYIDALADALDDRDADVRRQVVATLGQLKAARAVPPLMEALKDSDAEVRGKAAFALGQAGSLDAVEALVSALKDPDDEVRQHAVFALGQLRDRRAVDGLMGALSDRDPEVRQKAAFALGQLRDPRAVDRLVATLTDADPEVREHVAFALGQFRTNAAVPGLVKALQDPEEGVREKAAFALSQIRDPRAIDGLTAALRDRSAEVRKHAAFALGQIAKSKN